MGGNMSQNIDWIIWVEPAAYLRLPLAEKHEIGRLIGYLNRQISGREANRVMQLGPGRWGTTTASLGVPISFAEISTLTVLAEVAFPAGDLMPELSFGSHFFQDLVEADIFYLALFPEAEHCTLNLQRVTTCPNALATLAPSWNRFSQVVQVCPVPAPGLKVIADVVAQKVIGLFA